MTFFQDLIDQLTKERNQAKTDNQTLFDSHRALLDRLNRLTLEKNEMQASLQDLLEREPTNRRDLMCHIGLCDESECAQCQRVARARAAIR